MKRFLIIALVAMLVVGLMAVPAFADDGQFWEMTYNSDYLDSLPPAGDYDLTITFSSAEEGIPETTYSCRVSLKHGSVNVYEDVFEDGAYFDPISIPCYSDGVLVYKSVSLIIYPYVDEVMELDCYEGRITNSVNVTYLSLKPAAVTVEDVTGSVGSFFSFAFEMLGGVLSEIAASPALLVMVVALPLGGIAVAVVSKLKNA